MPNESGLLTSQYKNHLQFIMLLQYLKISCYQVIIKIILSISILPLKIVISLKTNISV